MLEALKTAAEAHGLCLRGGFHPLAADAVPRRPDGRAAASVVLLGNVGPALWSVFAASPEAADGAPHGLDRWTRRVVDALAAEVEAAPVYPFDEPPFHPFQRWARRAAPVVPSPLGVLIDPDYGLWHAYRAALLFATPLDLPPDLPLAENRAENRAVPCDTCVAKPCLTTCPVGAFTPQGYDVAACARHVAGAEGRACREGGCLARRACPVGRAYAYGPAQTTWHMTAFMAAGHEPKETI